MRLVTVLLFLTGTIFMTGCLSEHEKHKSVTVNKKVPVLDTGYTQFFSRDCCGVTGSDGTYSVLLPDGTTAWIFGDSFLGTVNEDLTREKRFPIFVRNAIAVQDGNKLKTYHGMVNEKEASLVIPEGAPVGSCWRSLLRRFAVVLAGRWFY